VKDILYRLPADPVSTGAKPTRLHSLKVSRQPVEIGDGINLVERALKGV
jgi:hypothetical protein